MLDTALIDAMDHALAFRALALTPEVVDVKAKLAEFRETSNKKIAAADRQLRAWIRAGERVREECRRMLKERTANDVDRTALSNVIAVVDRRVAKDAKDYEAIAKAYLRQQRDASRISPEVGAAVAAVTSASLRLLAREALERAEFGMFLRALKAELDPDAKGGPTFDDAGELRRFLESAAS